jgi:hypothetical protein
VLEPHVVEGIVILLEEVPAADIVDIAIVIVIDAIAEDRHEIPPQRPAHACFHTATLRGRGSAVASPRPSSARAPRDISSFSLDTRPGLEH